MDQKEYLDRLVDAIRETHRVEVIHLETVPVVEKFKGNVFWHGKVEVFQITGSSKVRILYAWGHPNDFVPGRLEITMVLSVDPINSPRRAVRAATRDEIRKIQTN